MSLVVARLCGAVPLMVADTRLIECDGVSSQLAEGAVKISIPTAEICVAFAGQIGFAEDALRTFSHAPSLGAVTDHFFDWHNRSDSKTEFIISVAGQNPAFTCIKNGTSVTGVQCWVGSHHGFEEFQRHSLQPPRVEAPLRDEFRLAVLKTPEQDGIDRERLLAIKHAMDLVIDDSKVPEVGGFSCIASCAGGRWQFLDYVDAYSNFIERAQLERTAGQWVHLKMGTAETGGYALNVTTANESFPCPLAVYVAQGQLGALYRSTDGGIARAQLFSKITALDFQDMLNLKFGLGFKISFVDGREYARRGWERFQKGHWALALADFNSAVECEPDGCNFRYARGKILASLQKYPEAIADLTEAVRLSPASAEAFHDRGVCYAKLGRYRMAVEDLLTAVALKPDIESGAQNLARAMADLERAGRSGENEKAFGPEHA